MKTMANGKQKIYPAIWKGLVKVSKEEVGTEELSTEWIEENFTKTFIQ